MPAIIKGMEFTCTECPDNTIQVTEGNTVWCSGCGAELGKRPVYLRGYANPITHVRRQAYSRAKRFQRYLRHVIQYSAVAAELLQNFDAIMDIYSAFEFLWQTGFKSSRKYFYAKPVMLKAACMLLGICPDSLPSLKDLEREGVQNKELVRLCHMRMAKMSALGRYL